MYSIKISKFVFVSNFLPNFQLFSCRMGDLLNNLPTSPSYTSPIPISPSSVPLFLSDNNSNNLITNNATKAVVEMVDWFDIKLANLFVKKSDDQAKNLESKSTIDPVLGMEILAAYAGSFFTAKEEKKKKQNNHNYNYYNNDNNDNYIYNKYNTNYIGSKNYNYNNCNYYNNDNNKINGKASENNKKVKDLTYSDIQYSPFSLSKKIECAAQVRLVTKIFNID